MSGRRRKVQFWGNFGTRNLGNECTLQAIIHNARKAWPDAELGCICPEPDDVRRRHGIEAREPVLVEARRPLPVSDAPEILRIGLGRIDDLAELRTRRVEERA